MGREVKHLGHDCCVCGMLESSGRGLAHGDTMLAPHYDFFMKLVRIQKLLDQVVYEILSRISDCLILFIGLCHMYQMLLFFLCVQISLFILEEQI